MKRILYLILALFFLTGFFPSSSFAQTPNNVRRDTKITLDTDEVVNDDYFAVGDTITISGTINGDVFVAGGQTFIDGTVNGDLLTAGGQVTVSGPITGDIRIAGGDIIISSAVGGNVTILGGNILIDDNATISGSLSGVVGNARILSPIGKSIHISGGQITLGGTVEKNVKAAVGKLALVNGAHIKGDLVYVSEEDVDISGGALVDGATVKKILPEQAAAQGKKDEGKKALLGLMGFGVLFWMVNAFLFGALFLGFAPRYTSNVIESIRSRFWMSLLVGFVFSVVTPIVIVILLFTIFGIPLALLGLVAYCALMMIGRIMFALFIGTKVQKYIAFAQNKYLVLLIGLILFSILTWIPFVGWLIGLVGSLVGLGALVAEKKNLYTAMRSKKIL